MEHTYMKKGNTEWKMRSILAYTTLGLTATSFRSARPLSSSSLVCLFLAHVTRKGRKRKGWEGSVVVADF